MRKKHEARKRQEDQPVQCTMRPQHSRPESICQCVRDSIALERPCLTSGKVPLIEVADYSSLALAYFILLPGAVFSGQPIEVVQIPEHSFVILFRSLGIRLEDHRIDHFTLERPKFTARMRIAHSRREDVINRKEFGGK